MRRLRPDIPNRRRAAALAVTCLVAAVTGCLDNRSVSDRRSPAGRPGVKRNETTTRSAAESSQAPSDSAFPKLEDVFYNLLTRKLAAAGQRGDMDAVGKLIAEGANVNEQGLDGVTPLIWAVAGRKPEAVRRLLRAGAKPDVRDDYGHTALILAARLGEPSVAMALIAGGADVNARGSDGRTALHHAVYARDAETVKRLLAAGANPNLADKSGLDARNTAYRLGADEVRKALFAADRRAGRGNLKEGVSK